MNNEFNQIEPMRRELSISVFFPVYNEEANIAESIYEAERVLRKLTYRYEIIVINDGSSDNTRNIVEQIQIFNPRVRMIEHAVNQGYGAALCSGIQAARYDWVFFTDGDLQFKLNELINLVEYIPLYDVVIGYRAPRKDPFMRLVNAKGWNILNQIFFGLKVRDIDCAFKLFRRDLVANLPIKSRGAMISAEILIRLQRRGVLFKELPVTHLPRTRGSPTGAKPAVIFRALKEMVALYKGDLGREDTTYMQAGKFGVIGVANTVLDIAIYFILTRFSMFFTDHILSAKLISFMAGTICSLMLNRKYTFRVNSKLTWAEVGRFYSTVGAGMVINVLALYVFNSLLHLNDLIAVAISTVITFVWGFIFSKFWVFNKEIKKTPAMQRKVAQEVA